MMVGRPGGGGRGRSLLCSSRSGHRSAASSLLGLRCYPGVRGLHPGLHRCRRCAWLVAALELRNRPRRGDLAAAGNRGKPHLRHTCAIAKYSITTDARFITRLTEIATLVDMPSMKAMKRGPISLQIRSMRLIWALTPALAFSKVRNTAGRMYQLTNLEAGPDHLR